MWRQTEGRRDFLCPSKVGSAGDYKHCGEQTKRKSRRIKDVGKPVFSLPPNKFLAKEPDSDH